MLAKKTNLRLICLFLGVYTLAFYFDPWLFLLSYIYVWACNGIFIEVFTHCYVVHRAYEFKNNSLKNIFYFLTLTIFPDVNLFSWTAVHRAHHAHANTVRDPFHANTEKRINFYQAITEQCSLPPNWKELTKDITSDPVILFCSKWREIFFVLWLVILACIDFKYMLWFGIMPVNISQLVITTFNLSFHQNNQTIDRPSFFWQTITWGASMHATHHKDSLSPSWPLHKFIVSLISKKKD